MNIALRNSIVAGNHGNTNQDLSGIFVDACPFLSGGYNLLQNISSTSLPIKLNQTDIVVGPRANLGIVYLLTETPFIPILVAGSPAIDRIPISACHYDGIDTDQRGMKRPDDHETTCDIGAYESTP